MDANGYEAPSHCRRLQEQRPPLGTSGHEGPPRAQPVVAEAIDRGRRRQSVVSVLLWSILVRVPGEIWPFSKYRQALKTSNTLVTKFGAKCDCILTLSLCFLWIDDEKISCLFDVFGVKEVAPLSAFRAYFYLSLRSHLGLLKSFLMRSTDLSVEGFATRRDVSLCRVGWRADRLHQEARKRRSERDRKVWRNDSAVFKYDS